jgi:DNA invertase Pin-like site-specific DNA recombinase
VTTTAALYARPRPLVPSITDQLQTFATQHCWSTREFADEEVASHTSWEACLEALREWQCRVLVVASLDRLGLRLPVLQRTISELAGAGVQVISLGEVVDTPAPEGRGFTDCSAVLVAYERARHAERTGPA